MDVDYSSAGPRTEAQAPGCLPRGRDLAGPQCDDRLDRPRVVARLTEPVRSPAGKTSFLRITLAPGPSGPLGRLTGCCSTG